MKKIFYVLLLTISCLQVVLATTVSNTATMKQSKLDPNKEIIEITIINKSPKVFEKLHFFPYKVAYEIMEGGLPLRPGESMKMLVVKKARNQIHVEPNCPPGVCNYSAACGDYPYDGLSAGTWIADRVIGTPVGPMIECHK